QRAMLGEAIDIHVCVLDGNERPDIETARFSKIMFPIVTDRAHSVVFTAIGAAIGQVANMNTQDWIIHSECIAMGVVVVPGTAAGRIKIKTLAEPSGEPTNLAASHVEASLSGQVGLAAVVSAVKANGQIVKQSVISPSGKIPDPQLIAARIIVVVIDDDVIAAASDKYSPTVVRRGNKCRRHVFADDVLAFLNRWIDFNHWTAIAVGAGMNIIHPAHKIIVLHGCLRKTDLVDRGQFFGRNQIEIVRKSSDRLVAEEVEGWCRQARAGGG